MIILDTNVISEFMRPAGSNRVYQWASGIRKVDMFTTAVSQGEVLFGLAKMPDGRKRDALVVQADAMFAEDFFGRILPYDQPAAAHFADIAAYRRRMGREIKPFDGQIAAIARAQGMAVATRNVPDFADCGVDIINPWET